MPDLPDAEATTYNSSPTCVYNKYTLPSLQSCYAIHPTTYTHLISSHLHLSFSFPLSSIEIDCAHHTASAQPSKHISTNQSSIHISTSRVLKSIQSNTRQTNHRPHSIGDRRDTCEAHRSKALSRASKQCHRSIVEHHSALTIIQQQACSCPFPNSTQVQSLHPIDRSEASRASNDSPEQPPNPSSHSEGTPPHRLLIISLPAYAPTSAIAVSESAVVSFPKKVLTT